MNFVPVGLGRPSAEASSLSQSPSSSSTIFGSLSLNLGRSPGTIGAFFGSYDSGL